MGRVGSWAGLRRGPEHLGNTESRVKSGETRKEGGN